MQSIKTSDIQFVKIINSITKYTINDNKYKYFSDKETIINLHSLSNIYESHYNDNIMIFFKEVSRDACIMMSLMWTYIFDLLELHKYQTQTMILNIE